MVDDIVRAWSEEFGMRPSIENTIYLMEILAQTKNPHKHRHKDIEMLGQSIEQVGFKNVVMLWQNDETGRPEVIYGAGRIMSADQKGLERLPVVWAQDFDALKAKLLRHADNIIKDHSNVYDDAIVVEDLKDLKFGNVDYSFLKMDRYDRFLVDDLAKEDSPVDLYEPPKLDPAEARPMNIEPTKVKGEFTPDGELVPDTPEELAEVERRKDPEYIPPEIELENATYPSDNEWEIPTLSLKFQATNVIDPVVKWGEISRMAKMSGTWHFYVEDAKFEPSIWKDPRGPLYSSAQAIVEVNYSAGPRIPAAWSIYLTYKKRWLARWWQSKGLRVFVDLNVSKKHDDINLLGVPYGWRAYATRGYNDLVERIQEKYALACTRAETDDIVFFVYGGGQKIQEYAVKKGWVWIPERMQVISNPKLAGKDGLAAKVSFDQFSKIDKNM